MLLLNSYKTDLANLDGTNSVLDSALELLRNPQTRPVGSNVRIATDTAVPANQSDAMFDGNSRADRQAAPATRPRKAQITAAGTRLSAPPGRPGRHSSKKKTE
jgi:hypothetical protein